MARARLLGAAVLCVLAAAGGPSEAIAGAPTLYVEAYNGTPLHQCHVPILFGVEASLPEPVERAVTDAFAYWESLSRRRLFAYAGRVPFGPDHPEAYGLVVVGARLDSRDNGLSTAFTRIRPVTSPAGCISSAGIYLHPDALELPATALTSALRHEVGHVLGLGHSDEPGGLMYPRTPRNFLKGVSVVELSEFRYYYE